MSNTIQQVRLLAADFKHIRAELLVCNDLEIPQEQILEELAVIGASAEFVVPEVLQPGRSAHAVKES